MKRGTKSILLLFLLTLSANSQAGIFDDIEDNDLDGVMRAITHDRDVLTIRVEGYTPLLYAAYKCQTKIFNFLIEKGADIHEIYAPLGSKAIHIAARQGCLSVLKEILKKYPRQIDLSRPGNLHTPLMLAIKSKDQKVIDALLNHVPKPNLELSAPSTGTALQLASSEGDYTSAEKLLKKGAQVDFSADLEPTALYRAVVGGHFSVASLLMRHGATFGHAIDDRPARQMLLAAAAGDLSTLKGLHEEGASPYDPGVDYQSTDFSGNTTPLLMAYIRNRSDATNKDFPKQSQAAYKNLVEQLMAFDIDLAKEISVAVSRGFPDLAVQLLEIHLENHPGKGDPLVKAQTLSELLTKVRDGKSIHPEAPVIDPPTTAKESCSICLQGLEQPSPEDAEQGTKDLSVVRCGHIFHKNCLSQWTKLKSTCPVCRRDHHEAITHILAPEEAPSRAAQAPGIKRRSFLKRWFGL